MYGYDYLCKSYSCESFCITYLHTCRITCMPYYFLFSWVINSTDLIPAEPLIMVLILVMGVTVLVTVVIYSVSPSYMMSFINLIWLPMSSLSQFALCELQNCNLLLFAFRLLHEDVTTTQLTFKVEGFPKSFIRCFHNFSLKRPVF